MIALNALKNVEASRLAKAATALMDGGYFVTISQCSQFYLSGCVRGKEKSYQVTLTATSAHCECEDSRFHHSHCKHVAMLALTIVRAMQDEEPTPEAFLPCGHQTSYGNVAGCQKCGSMYMCEAPALPPPNLKLAKVRRECYARSAAF